MDLHGRICHRWHCHEGISYAYLLPTGHLLLRTNAGPVEVAFISTRHEDGRARQRRGGAAVLELDWDSNLVWAYRHPMLHHDFERLPNGHTLVLLWEEIPAELAAQVRGGFRAAREADRMLGDTVQEITPEGTIVDEWRSWQHLSLEEDVICPLEGRHEWPHQNALTMTPDGDLLVSFRQTSTVGIVDRATGNFS